ATDVVACVVVASLPKGFGFEKSQGVRDKAAVRWCFWSTYSAAAIDAYTFAAVVAGVVNRATTMSLLPNPLVMTRTPPLPGKPQGRSTTIVSANPEQVIGPPGGGDAPPVPACE